MIQALVRWRTSASLKIYARINPRDYAARVRRMSQTNVDSTIAAHLPSICDSELHASMGPVMEALAGGKDISETCPIYESDEEDDGEPAPRATGACAPAPVVDRSADRGAAEAPPAKRRAVADFGIALKQSNPKRAGSKSHARYEQYKAAKTRAHFRALGGSSADYAHDMSKGYVTLLSS